MPVPIRFHLYHHKQDNEGQAVEDEWGSLSSILSEPSYTDCKGCQLGECDKKDGLAWSPVHLKPETTRHNDNVEVVTALVLDLDHLSLEEMKEAAAKLEGYRFIFHTTHSNNPQGEPRIPLDEFKPELCARAVVALSREVAAKDWRTFRARAIELLGIKADPSCKDLSRLYFLPSVRVGGPFISEVAEGKPLDVDALLGRPVLSLAPGEPEPAVDLAELRRVITDKKNYYARSSRAGAKENCELLRAVLDGQALAVKNNRSNTVNKTVSILAACLPYPTPWEALRALIYVSIATMEVAPEGLDHWLGVAEKSYTRAQARRAQADADRAALKLAIQDRIRGMAPPANPDEDWTLQLQKDKNDAVRATGSNIALILENSPETAGFLAFNEITKNIDVRGGLFAGYPCQTLHIGIAHWLQRLTETNFKSYEVKETIVDIARRNPYDPLAERLLGLKWDGVNRLDTAFEVYFNALTVDDEGRDCTPYLRLISPKWFVGCVARALCIGEKVDTVLIFESGQGEHKSQTLKRLGGSFYAEISLNLGDKDSSMQASRSWITELGELASVKSARSIYAIKSFLSRQVDSIRPPYGAAIEEFPRRAIFVGSTNEEQYLVDDTGNRRSWPIRVGTIDLDQLERDVDQLWAEAVFRYHRFLADARPKNQRADRWWLIKEEQLTLADAVVEDRMIESPIEQQITDYWAGIPENKRPEFVQTHVLAAQVLAVTPEKVASAAPAIGKALRRLGFKRTKKRLGPSRTIWVYVPGDDFAKMPHSKTQLRLVGS